LKVPPPRIQPDQAAPTDMASYVKAQRERRMAAQGYTEKDSVEITAKDTPISEDDRRNTIISRNLQQQGTGGLFEIRNRRIDSAQLSFKGWKSNSRHEIFDIEVERNGNLELAIVRKVIFVIRRDYSTSAPWDSRRLGRVIDISVRPEDNDGLEDFLMKEFFGAGGISSR